MGRRALSGAAGTSHRSDAPGTQFARVSEPGALWNQPWTEQFPVYGFVGSNGTLVPWDENRVNGNASWRPFPGCCRARHDYKGGSASGLGTHPGTN